MTIADKVQIWFGLAFITWALATSVPHSKPKTVQITNRVGNPPGCAR